MRRRELLATLGTITALAPNSLAAPAKLRALGGDRGRRRIR